MTSIPPPARLGDALALGVGDGGGADELRADRAFGLRAQPLEQDGDARKLMQAMELGQHLEEGDEHLRRFRAAAQIAAQSSHQLGFLIAAERGIPGSQQPLHGGIRRNGGGAGSLRCACWISARSTITGSSGPKRPITRRVRTRSRAVACGPIFLAM